MFTITYFESIILKLLQQEAVNKVQREDNKLKLLEEGLLRKGAATKSHTVGKDLYKELKNAYHNV
jgi:hypothetical protein